MERSQFSAAERILTLCSLTDKARCAAEEQIQALSSQGLRVIAIAAAHPENEAAIPAAITDCRLTLLGLVGLADPPRESVKNDIAVCNRAGIRVVMITGHIPAPSTGERPHSGHPLSRHCC